MHLELIKYIYTVAFLHVLKRLKCTRRSPRKIWSDNATNFDGAKSDSLELMRLFLSDDQELCLAENIVAVHFVSITSFWGSLGSRSKENKASLLLICGLLHLDLR